MDKLIKIIERPSEIIIFIIRVFSILFSDRTYIEIIYYLKTGKLLDLDNPETFNEKIQWLKLNDRNQEYTDLVDKYKVKAFIEKKIGKKHIIKTLGVWDNFSDIDFDNLPDKFILKATHDSGTVVFCKKNDLNILKAKKRIEKSLKRNYYYVWREWPYKNVKPRILAEEYIVDESGTELKDFKFFCFDGTAKFIQVDFDRFTNHKRNIYDIDWNLLDLQIGFPSDNSRKIERPRNFDKMIQIAETLSKDFSHIRVDLYSVHNEIYFGELTFYHGSGFESFLPKEGDKLFGELIKLRL